MEIVEKVETKAVGTVVLVAVLAEECFLLALSHDSAVAAFHWVWILFSNHHALILMLATGSISIEAHNILADGDSLLLSLELHHFISEELDDVDMVSLQLCHVIILEALMLCEFSSSKLFHTNLALNHHFGAELLDVVSKLGSSHVLEFSKVADVATVLGALVILSVLLEFSN